MVVKKLAESFKGGGYSLFLAIYPTRLGLLVVMKKCEYSQFWLT